MLVGKYPSVPPASTVAVKFAYEFLTSLHTQTHTHIFLNYNATRMSIDKHKAIINQSMLVHSIIESDGARRLDAQTLCEMSIMNIVVC